MERKPTNGWLVKVLLDLAASTLIGLNVWQLYQDEPYWQS